MSKAFDSADHQILVGKIENVRTSTSVLKWFNSYLRPQIDIQLFEFKVPFLILCQLNLVALRVVY